MIKVKGSRYIIYLFIIVLSWSCNNYKQPIRLILDYSSGSGWGYSYSIKVYTDGKAYLKKNSVKQFDSLWAKKEVNIDELNTIVSKTQGIKLAASYEQQNIEDASCFNVIFYYVNGKISKHYIYGHEYPKLLGEIKKYCDNLEQEKSWNKLRDTIIVFKSLSPFLSTSKLKIDANVRFPPPLPQRKK